MKTYKLSAKHQRFVTEYVHDFNISRAARRTGYTPQHACRLMHNPAIMAAIQQERQLQDRLRQAISRRIVEQLLNIILVDPRDLMTWGADGVTLKDAASLTPELASCVDISISESAEGMKMDLKLCDRQAALHELIRYLGLKPTAPQPGEKTEEAPRREYTREELCQELRNTLRALEGDDYQP